MREVSGEPEGGGAVSVRIRWGRHGPGVDLTETHALLEVFTDLGIGLVSTTAGSPYYNPHIQRPAYFPPSDGYQPPEDPLVGVARQLAVTGNSHMPIPNSRSSVRATRTCRTGWSTSARRCSKEGGASMIGLGRMMLSYPEPRRGHARRPALDTRLICRTFSDCTTAPRSGLVSGCYPLDPFYKAHPSESS